LYISEPGLGCQVPLGKRVCDFAEPGLAADQLGVDVLVGDQVHVVGPSVEPVVVVLLVHAHVEED